MIDGNDAFEVGNGGEDYVESHLKEHFKDVRITPKEINLQLEWADIVLPAVPSLGIPAKKIEVKTEQRHTGNLFWEWWSNRREKRKGWGQTTPADELIYLFTDKGIGYRITDLQNLIWLIDYYKQEWELKEQNKYVQSNDSWGYCIPVSWLQECAGRCIEFKMVR